MKLFIIAALAAVAAALIPTLVLASETAYPGLRTTTYNKFKVGFKRAYISCSV
jgi:hypothetical protein